MRPTISLTFTLAGRQLPPLTVYDTPVSRFVAEDILAGRAYPPMPSIGQARTIVDVGANVGATSVWFATLYPNSRIVACEPSPETFALLRQNVAPWPNIEPHHLGLHRENGSMKLYAGDSGVMDTIHPPKRADNLVPASASVPIEDAREFLANRVGPEIDILKVDTEGCELPILERIADRLPSIKALYIEYHSEDDRRAIDALLAPSHLLVYARVVVPHTGELCYVARDVYAP